MNHVVLNEAQQVSRAASVADDDQVAAGRRRERRRATSWRIAGRRRCRAGWARGVAELDEEMERHPERYEHFGITTVEPMPAPAPFRSSSTLPGRSRSSTRACPGIGSAPSRARDAHRGSDRQPRVVPVALACGPTARPGVRRNRVHRSRQTGNRLAGRLRGVARGRSNPPPSTLVDGRIHRSGAGLLRGKRVPRASHAGPHG